MNPDQDSYHSIKQIKSVKEVVLRQVFTLNAFYFFFNITLGKYFLTQKNPLDLKCF